MIDLVLNCGFGTYISANVSDVNQIQKNLVTTENQFFVDQINHNRKEIYLPKYGKKLFFKFLYDNLIYSKSLGSSEHPNRIYQLNVKGQYLHSSQYTDHNEEI